MNEIVVDTNVVAAFLGGEAAIVEAFVQTKQILVALTVLGELHYGAFASSRHEQNLARINRLWQWTTILIPDEAVAALYGSIKNQLREAGRMIPDNDIWVAASARRVDAPLISRDRHFAAISQLNWQVW